MKLLATSRLPKFIKQTIHLVIFSDFSVPIIHHPGPNPAPSPSESSKSRKIKASSCGHRGNDSGNSYGAWHADWLDSTQLDLDTVFMPHAEHMPKQAARSLHMYLHSVDITYKTY